MRKVASVLHHVKGLLKSRRGGARSAKDGTDKSTATDAPIDRNPSTLISNVPRGVVLWEVSYRRNLGGDAPRFISTAHMICTVSSHVVKALRFIVRRPDASEWSTWISDEKGKRTYTLRDQVFRYAFPVEFIRCNVQTLTRPYFKHEHIWKPQQEEPFRIRAHDSFTLGQYRVDVRAI